MTYLTKAQLTVGYIKLFNATMILSGWNDKEGKDFLDTHRDLILHDSNFNFDDLRFAQEIHFLLKK